MRTGRPTLYQPVFNEQARKLCLLGATDKDLAAFFEVTEQTIANWKNEHPDFFESIKAGKEVADAYIAERLFERAAGFEHDSEEIKVVAMGDKQGSEVVRVPVRKIYPPDPTAAIFWLKNRRPDLWRDKHEISGQVRHSGSLHDGIDYSKLSDQTLREIANARLQPESGAEDTGK